MMNLMYYWRHLRKSSVLYEAGKYQETIEYYFYNKCKYPISFLLSNSSIFHVEVGFKFWSVFHLGESI